MVHNSVILKKIIVINKITKEMKKRRINHEQKQNVNESLSYDILIAIGLILIFGISLGFGLFGPKANPKYQSMIHF